MKTIIKSLLLIALFVGVSLTSCQKDQVNEITGPKVNPSEINNPDTRSGAQATGLISTREAYRYIEFGSDLPNSIFYYFNLAEPSNVQIYAEDGFIQDDVVEIWVDGCLIATVDSRGYTGGTYSETHTVTLMPGDHTVEYRNVESSVGPSGWYVEELFLPYSTLVIDGCDTGVPNFLLPSCVNMSTMIYDCAANAKNHGAFVSCVAHLTNDWKKAGYITGYQKDIIQSCAAEADLP